MEPEFYIAPGSVAQPTSPKPAAPPQPVGGERIDWASDANTKAPKLNLIKPTPLPGEPVVAVAGMPVAGGRNRWIMVGVAGVVVVMVASAAVLLAVMKRPASHPVAQITPTPSLAASATPIPTPTPTVSPTPAPTPALGQQALTVPTVTPTADHPQSSTVTSPTGLWLRSSPTSVNRSNIIGWMPKGAQVSVDQVGDFWWHGTYKGQSGYFASKYTQ